MAEAIQATFGAHNCLASLHVRSLRSNAQFAIDADRPMIMASIFKPFVALELFTQAEANQLDLEERVRSSPKGRIPGPTGLSTFHDEVELSLRDLARLMATISDNEATDLLLSRVGILQVRARLRATAGETTRLRSPIGDMLDDLGREMGFASYAELLDAQVGKHGNHAFTLATDQQQIDRCAALDPARGSVTTAREMTTALAMLWSNKAAPAGACREVRDLMAAQVTRRLDPAVPAGGHIAAKSGGLFGRVRNEIAVISCPDGDDYAVAILTQTTSGFGDASAINAAMAEAVRLAIATLRA